MSSFIEQIKSLAISFDKFKEIFVNENLNNVVSDTHHVEMKNRDVLFKFFSLYMTTPDRVGYTHCYPEAGQSSSNYRYRFVIVSINEDYVLSYFKMADNRRGHRYIQFYPPISLSGKRENEYFLVESLKSDGIKSDVRLFTTEKTSDKYIFNNYFNTKESSLFFFENKWKGKNQIKKFEQIHGLSVEFHNVCDEKTFNDVIGLYEIWESVKKQKSDKKYDKKLFKMMNEYDTISLMTIKINGHLIAFSAGFDFVNNFFIIQTEKHVSVCEAEFIKQYACVDDETASLIKKRLSAYIQYKSHEHYIKDLGKDALFYEGDVHMNNLAKYKSMFYKHCVCFYDKRLKN